MGDDQIIASTKEFWLRLGPLKSRQDQIQIISIEWHQLRWCTSVTFVHMHRGIRSAGSAHSLDLKQRFKADNKAIVFEVPIESEEGRYCRRRSEVSQIVLTVSYK